MFKFNLVAPEGHGVRPLLEKQLDWDNDIERDLIQIAYHMLSWEEKLCPHLELNVVDVHDTKERNSGKPELQRCAIIMRLLG